MSEAFREHVEQPVATSEHVSEDDSAVATLRRASQQLYDAIQYYLMGIPDSQLPPELVAAFDAMEEAMRRSE